MTGQFFWTAGVVLACTAVFGQTPQNLTFEVASVKPSPPPAPNVPVFFGPPRGGPGTHDPGQITWSNAALRNVVMTAYDMETFQVTAPDWLSNERYDIVAKVPEGATKGQVEVMWQNLLKERFGMVVHRESKEFQVEELTVAKGGLKMKQTELPADAEPFTPEAVKPGKNGPDFNGTGLIVSIFPSKPGQADAEAHMVAKGLTMPEIAAKFGQAQRHPVLDKTGLTGRYDLTVEYTLDLSGLPPPPDLPPQPPTAQGVASDPGSNFPSAIEKQLGLKLTPGKAMLDVIVVDRAQKTPTEN
jgi:uncharacterized protein (TIGR03435 family)